MPFFKYTDFNGAKKILSDGSILFSSPLRLNDPFDVSIQTIFNYDPIAMLQDMQRELTNLLCSPDPWPCANGSHSSKAAAFLHQCMLQATPEQRESVRTNTCNALWNIESLREINADTLNKIKLAFESTGVFSCTKRHDNQLLWAYYAKGHTGVVLEFEPSLENDSLLRLAEPVRYCETRPILYESPKDFLEKSLFFETADILNEYGKRITMEKSMDWLHEEELRICIPRFVDPLIGEVSRLHKFHDDELRGVYLGCRMSSTDREEILQVAKLRFPNAAIHQMTQDARQYRLTPCPLQVL